MPFVAFLWLIYFITQSFYILIPFAFYAHPFTPRSFGNHQLVLVIYEYIFVFFLFVCFVFLDSTYEWNHMVFTFLCLFHLAQYPPDLSMLSQMAKFHSFLWVIFCCYMYHISLWFLEAINYFLFGDYNDDDACFILKN